MPRNRNRRGGRGGGGKKSSPGDKQDMPLFGGGAHSDSGPSTATDAVTIFVDLAGEHLPVNVYLHWQVDELRQIVFVDSGGRWDEAGGALTYEGAELEEGARTLQDYGIREGSVIVASDPLFDPPGTIKVTVQTASGNSDKIEVSPYLLFAHLRELCKLHFGDQAGSELMFRGARIRDNLTIDSYGIREGSVVSEPFPVRVQLASLIWSKSNTYRGEPQYTEVTASGSHTVRQLKQAVERTAKYRHEFEDFGFDEIFGGLTFEGVELDDDQLLFEYKMREGSVAVATPLGTEEDRDRKSPALVTPTNDDSDAAGQSPLQRFEDAKPAAQAALPLANANEKFTVPVRLADESRGEIVTTASARVREFRQALLHRYGLHSVGDELSFNGARLEDGKFLADYNISPEMLKHSAVFARWQKGERAIPFKVHVQFPDGEVGEIEAMGYQTVRFFKDAVERDYPEHVTKKMTFQGIQLEEDKQLSHYNIGEGSMVAMQMQVYVGFLAGQGQGFLLDVEPDTTIAEAKLMIENRMRGFPVTEQRIFLDGKNQDDGMTLRQCKIADNANLFVIVRENVPPLPEGKMHIYVRYQDRIITVDISPMDTLGELKTVLERKENIPTNLQRLSFAGEYQEDDSKALYECEIWGECLVDLVRRQGTSGADAMPYHLGHGMGDQAHYGQNESSFALRFIDGTSLDVPIALQDTTPLRQFFTEYSRRANVPVSNLDFHYGEYGQLPADCPAAPRDLGIENNAVIAVSQAASRPYPEAVSPTASHPHPAAPFGTEDAVLDLTPFSEGTVSAEDCVEVTLRSNGNDETRAKLNRNDTTLQLLFSEYADQRSIEPQSLFYICDARRLSHKSEETAAHYGIVDGDVIHSLVRSERSGQENVAPRTGTITMNVAEIGKPPDFFRVNVNARLCKFLEQFATRKEIALDTLRFVFQGSVLYADSFDDATPLQLGFREGDTVQALVKKRKRPKSLTPDAVKTLKSLPPNAGTVVFEPVLQVTGVNKQMRELGVSDGGEAALFVDYHKRLDSLVDSGVIREHAVIWANDISVGNSPSGLLLLDAEEAAPNPGRALVSSKVPLDFDEWSKQETRLSMGLPYLASCTICRSANDTIKTCKRCKFMGYCSGECQTIGWKERGHKNECRYYQTYHEFLDQFDGKDPEIADIFDFWTDLQDGKGQLDKPVATSMYNTSLYSAFSLLENDLQPSMAKAYVLNAGFLKETCINSPVSEMAGPGGVPLESFLSEAPHFKEAYDAISSKTTMMAYLRAKGAYDESIVGSPIFEDEVKITVKAGEQTVDACFIGLHESLEDYLDGCAYGLDMPLRELQFTLVQPNSSVLVPPTNTPDELEMKGRGEYTINVAPWGAAERRAQIVISNFVGRQLRLRRVRKILARNIIADVVWRHHEDKARKAIADFVWHHHQQRKARKAIANLIWRRIAFDRRQKLRDSATAIQRISRGHATRNVHLEPLQRRLEEFRRFSATWKRAIERVPTATQSLAGWALVRDTIDVRKVELLDEDGDLKETDDKLNQALSSALNEEEEEEDDVEEEELEAEVDGLPEGQRNAEAMNSLANIDWRQFQVTSHVVKFMKSGDAKYREIFVKKMRQLARGERSHKLQKPLKGCKSIIFESYLENKSGFRILWTQEGDSIVVWFVAKHKSVSRYAELIDDAKNRTARQQLPQSFVSELENGDSQHQAPARREVLLDACGNVPLKLYDVSFDTIDDMVDNSWAPQMHLTEEERQVVEAKGTVLLLGRSGTGKTVCICNRMEFDRQRLGAKGVFTQLFLSRSSRLCRYVESAVGKTDGSTFTTFDKHVRHLESVLKEELKRSFHADRHVQFARFKTFYSERYPQEGISALIVWKAIKTFIKGSIEAFQSPTGVLSRDHFVGSALGRNRCKVPSELREPIYDIFLRYAAWMEEEHLWDDCDHIVALLKAIEDAKKNPDSLVYEECIKTSKLYVDEVQDYTQIEILLFFYIGRGPGALFLAGDPAQSVVEGTDFRFEEVRSVGYFVAGEKRHLVPEKPKIVNVNFRSHAGVLNCAGGFLDLLFEHFPGSAKMLKKDHGLFKGARPGVFRGVQIQQLSSLLKERMQGAVVLVHDECAERWKKALGHPLVYGIREAKGLEFKTVVILDFWGELPSKLHQPWRDLLSTTKDKHDFERKYPLVETHLKLVYTAVTRCIETLFFAETSSSTAGDAAVKWLTKTRTTGERGSSDVLATQNSVDDLESMEMTADEFAVVGIDNAELAESSEIELNQALSYLDRAIYCFEKAQHSELVTKAQTHCQSVQLRKRLGYAGSYTSDGKRQAMEEEAAQVLESLLQQNLLAESLDLLASIIPFLSHYTQQKLEDEIASKVRESLDA